MRDQGNAAAAPAGASETVNATNNATGGCNSCGSLFDFSCYVSNLCVTKIVVSVIVAVALVILIIVGLVIAIVVAVKCPCVYVKLFMCPINIFKCIFKAIPKYKPKAPKPKMAEAEESFTNLDQI